MNRRDIKREKLNNLLDIDISWRARHDETLAGHEVYTITIDLQNTGNKKFVIKELQVHTLEKRLIFRKKPEAIDSLRKVIGSSLYQECYFQHSEKGEEKPENFHFLINQKKLILTVVEESGKEFSSIIS